MTQGPCVSESTFLARLMDLNVGGTLLHAARQDRIIYRIAAVGFYFLIYTSRFASRLGGILCFEEIQVPSRLLQIVYVHQEDRPASYNKWRSSPQGSDTDRAIDGAVDFGLVVATQQSNVNLIYGPLFRAFPRAPEPPHQLCEGQSISSVPQLRAAAPGRFKR